jgi:hypothetical protein
MDALWGDDARYVGRAFVGKARGLGFKLNEINERVHKKHEGRRNERRRQEVGLGTR